MKLKLISGNEISEFKMRYESLSGLEIPDDFLKKSRVYGFYQNKILIAGFVLSSSNERLRTVELFVAQQNHREVYLKLSDLALYTEVCCFWMDKKKKKKNIVNIRIWLKMAYRIRKDQNPIIIYGTQSKGLAYLYGLPKVSTLFWEDTVNELSSYVFLVSRNEFVKGAWEMAFSKFLRKNRPKTFVNHYSPSEIISLHRSV